MKKKNPNFKKSLTAWQKVQIARHPDRPYTKDYINNITDDFVELHGDRNFGDDNAIIGGLASIDSHKVMIIGHQKGRSVDENIHYNFGMPHPEGYRKALRLMKLAEKFSLPIINFIDTPGAYPGIKAEERGQAEAIARNLKEMSAISVPIIVIIIGEGGSGGALGIGVGNVVLMLENTIYSVISPEGCASILWRDAKFAETASDALKLTPKDLLNLEVIDEIIKEPLEGAHINSIECAQNVKKTILKYLKSLNKLSKQKIIENRYNKFRKMGNLALETLKIK